MDRLLEELTSKGLLGAREAEWASSCSDERQIAIDSALLELDLVDEEGLLQALRTCTGLASASGADLAQVDVEPSTRLPQAFARSFSICPLRRSDNHVVALVKWPLADDSLQELKEVFRLDVEQKVAPSHVIALALERIYGIPAGQSCHALEDKLTRHRKIEGVAGVLNRWRQGVSLAAALADVLTFATERAEFACLLARQGNALRTLTVSAAGMAKGAPLALPDRASALWPALSQSGYFIGPPTGGEADARFYRDLNRPLPRWVCLIPVPVGSKSSLVFHCDNGSRGLATRWVAEFVLLVSRVGQIGGSRSEPSVTPSAPPAACTAQERAVLDKLARAAAGAGMPLDAFVDGLLRAPPQERTDERAQGALLVGEVRGLFEKLAHEIPTHFARGMEAAFRELAPKMAAMTPPAGAAPSPPRSPAAEASTVGGVELVRAPEAAREVATYQSRRRKTDRVKL